MKKILRITAYSLCGLLFFFFLESSLTHALEPFTTQKGILIIPGVPFTSQAPTGDWKNSHFQNGCEEATVLMAMQWVQGKKSLTKNQAKKEILNMANFQEKTYGSAMDTSAQDTADRLFKEYYGYTNVHVQFDITKKDILAELQKGNIVIIPANGRKLKNPYFTQPGPLEHMILVYGYDKQKKEFITHDPGTRRGEKYRYKESVLESAIRDYPTGSHESIKEIKRVMIAVEKKI